MLSFQLFRIQVFPNQQANFYTMGMTPTGILRELIGSFPSAALRGGSVWHIANVTSLDHAGYYFRIGRISRTHMEVYENGNFIDREFEAAPYTHVLLDVNLELCAIAKKPRLAPHAFSVAKQFERLLEQSEAGRNFQASFSISEIPNPDDFIAQLRDAVTVTRFWVEFSRPNAWDLNRDFIQPSQQMLEAAHGRRGKTALTGPGLDPAPLEEIARSAASVGEDAGATLQLNGSDAKVKKSLKGNPVVVDVDADLEEQEPQWLDLLDRIRHTYHRVRGNGGDGDAT